MTKDTGKTREINITQGARVFKLRQIMLILVLSLALITLISGCNNNDNASPADVSPAEEGDAVSVNYTLRLDDGTVFDSSEGKDPLQFTIGSGNMIPGFNDAVIGMKPGESKTVTIPAEEAYGPRLDERVIEVDRSELPANIVPEVGMILQASNSGSIVEVTIVAVSDLTVTIDFNHPLAGKNLTFDIELLEIL